MLASQGRYGSSCHGGTCENLRVLALIAVVVDVGKVAHGQHEPHEGRLILREGRPPLSLNMIMPLSPPVSRTCALGSCALVNVRIRSVLDVPGRLACGVDAFWRLPCIFSSKGDAMSVGRA